ncbi:hypothetical protein N9S81_00520, partial [bacterium]|nr:hypothetical protein [bacterium]
TQLGAVVTAYFLSVNHRPNLEASWRGFIFLFFLKKIKNLKKRPNCQIGRLNVGVFPKSGT